MEHRHLDATALERLLATDRTTEQNEQLFHLLAVCPRCREVGGWLLELHQAKALPPHFGPVDAALARSRAEAPRLLEELASLDHQDRLARLHADPRFLSWGLCELLVQRSREAASEQTLEAIHLAELAVHMADMIPEGDPFEDRWLYQLRSLAWAGLSNARRVQGDLSEAERCSEQADSWWGAGTVGSDDALGYEPVLLDLKASLRRAQRRFPEALELHDRAVHLFLEGEPDHRDPHLAGRTLINKASVLIEAGDTDSGILTLKKANGLIDPDRDPRLLLCVRHNLVDTLARAGRYREAADLLPGVQELAALHGSALDRVRLDWVEARISAGLGDHEHARMLLTHIRETFLADGNPFDAALADLDLAISYLEEGRTAEVRDLAEEMVTVFRNLDISREALAALLLFQESARQETATTTLARNLATALTRTREDMAKSS
jgi:tetratricopeptide (TPR) repeat protein